VGRLPGHRQVTLYIDPVLYEKVRCAAYTLGEDIYEFINESLEESLTRRMTKAQRAAIESMSKHNLKNGGVHRRRNPAL
jgi:hypothetical protein